MSSSYRIPAGARKKPRTDRFGQVVKPVPLVSHDHVNELLLECRDCNAHVLVCGHVDDLDPELYQCLGCRLQLEPSTEGEA